MVVFLALLMVSTVRYRTFKDAKPTPKTAAVLLFIIVTGVGIGVWSHPAWVLVAYFGLYLVSGRIESVVLMYRRAMAPRVATASLVDVLDEDEGDDDGVEDEEVL